MVPDALEAVFVTKGFVKAGNGDVVIARARGLLIRQQQVQITCNYVNLLSPLQKLKRKWKSLHLPLCSL